MRFGYSLRVASLLVCGACGTTSFSLTPDGSVGDAATKPPRESGTSAHDGGKDAGGEAPDGTTDATAPGHEAGSDAKTPVDAGTDACGYFCDNFDEDMAASPLPAAIWLPAVPDAGAEMPVLVSTAEHVSGDNSAFAMLATAATGAAPRSASVLHNVTLPVTAKTNGVAFDVDMYLIPPTGAASGTLFAVAVGDVIYALSFELKYDIIQRGSDGTVVVLGTLDGSDVPSSTWFHVDFTATPTTLSVAVGVPGNATTKTYTAGATTGFLAPPLSVGTAAISLGLTTAIAPMGFQIYYDNAMVGPPQP